MLIAIVPRPTHSHVQRTPKGPTSTRALQPAAPRPGSTHRTPAPPPPPGRRARYHYQHDHRAARNAVHSILSFRIAIPFFFFFFQLLSRSNRTHSIPLHASHQFVIRVNVLFRLGLAIIWIISNFLKGFFRNRVESRLRLHIPGDSI